MSAINRYPVVWYTHITRAGELYVSRRFRPVRVVHLRNRICIYCNVLPEDSGESEGSPGFFKTYVGLGVEVGRFYVPEGKTSAKVSLLRNGSTGYVLPIRKC